MPTLPRFVPRPGMWVQFHRHSHDAYLITAAEFTEGLGGRILCLRSLPHLEHGLIFIRLHNDNDTVVDIAVLYGRDETVLEPPGLTIGFGPMILHIYEVGK